MQKEGYAHISVITDGQWMDSYDYKSDFEKSQVYVSSYILEEMWLEFDLQSEHVVCSVHYYMRNGMNASYSIMSLRLMSVCVQI